MNYPYIRKSIVTYLENETLYIQIFENNGFDKYVYFNIIDELYNTGHPIFKCKDKKLLELGCGSARWGISLIDTIKSYVGVDISEKQIEIARDNLKDKAELFVSNLTEFNTEERFDIIYFSGVLQYMDDKDAIKIIKKSKKWLNPSGVLISRDSITKSKRWIAQKAYKKPKNSVYRRQKV